jgi:zinc/manganese transport system substrate-binding protein
MKTLIRLIASIVIVFALSFQAYGLKIVVTFPSLKEDLKAIAPNDSIYAIPAFSHDYQLTPVDVEQIKSADVIVSTAHMHFELKIREVVESGEIKAELIEIPKIKGIKLMKNPETGQINLHMPIYDPQNYKTFIFYTAGILQKLNPKGNYVERAEEVTKEVDEIVKNAKKLNVKAVADYPYTPYAVGWLNVSVVHLIVKEYSLPTSPDVKNIFEEDIGLVVVTKPLSAKSEVLIDFAREKGIPILYVDSPLVEKSIPEKLRSFSLEEPKKTPGFDLTLVISALLLALGWRKWS